MGFDATRFVVGDEWVYRLRDACASERVRILAVTPKKNSARVDVVFVDDPQNRIETVPGSRLRAPWSQVEAYDALMANWSRLDAAELDDVERGCAGLVYDLLIPDDVAAIEWSPVQYATSIQARARLEEIIRVPVADVLACAESFDLDGVTMISPTGTLLVAEAACRANPAPILDKVLEEETEARHKCKHGSERANPVTREREPTSPEWEYYCYRRFDRPGTRTAASMVRASGGHLPRTATGRRSREPAARRPGRNPDQSPRPRRRHGDGRDLRRRA
jgi:hypothetical protein